MGSDLRSPIGNAPVYHTTETASTMDDARRLVRGGAPSGTVVVTDFQSEGRGRRAGRVWHSAPNESLMFTLALERPDDPVTRSLVMAASVALVLEERFGLEVSVKWPNDVLVLGRKICGILADHETGWLYLGVGLNVRQASFPDELAPHATSIRLVTSAGAGSDQTGICKVSDTTLLLDLLERFRSLGDRWHDVLSARLWSRGELVEVVVPGGSPIRGRVTGIERDGRLIVSGDRVHRLAAGEVSLSRKASNENTPDV